VRVGQRTPLVLAVIAVAGITYLLVARPHRRLAGR